MDAAVNEGLCLLEHGAGEDDYARCSIANLVVLRLRQLDHELCDLVLDLHAFQDGRAVVRDCDVAVGRDEDLVETSMYAARQVARRGENGSGA